MHGHHSNWRQFIGTTFAVFLLKYPDRLPAELRARLEESIRRAVEGEIHEDRLTPAYTNIALMHGFLWVFAGQRFNHPAWITAGEAWATAIHAGFAPHQTFEEYNSPTYYGVDLYSLALWRALGPTDHLRHLGAAMETSGATSPRFTMPASAISPAPTIVPRIGTDLTRYVSLTGAWLGLELDPAIAPFPELNRPMDHAFDFLAVPCYAILGAQIPADALPHFQRFQGERQVTRTITPQRTATAWLGANLMLGGESTSLSRSAGASSRTQFYPATIHWKSSRRRPRLVWLRDTPRLDVLAAKNTLAITAIGDSIFRLSVPGLSAATASAIAGTSPV